MKKIKKSIEIGGRTLTLETGQLAGQANAAVIARYGDTMVLVAVVASEPKEDLDYLPLYVEYQERLYAGGRIKGSRWVKREGRPSDEAILTARLIDRSIRPLFPKGYQNELQITITILSVDTENDPGILSAVATSAALAISDIPWNGPVGTVRVGLKEEAPFVNPVDSELEFSELDLIVSAGPDKVVMLEGSGKQVPETQLLTAIEFGRKEAGKLIDLINAFGKELNIKKQTFESRPPKKEMVAEAKKFTKKHLGEVSYDHGILLESFIEQQGEANNKKETIKAFDEVFRQEVRKMILAGRRPDGRKPEDIRPLAMEVGLLPRTHGSALFQRGETQVLTVTTLGSPSLEQLIESAVGEESKRYIHHYAMPPFSLGEVGRFGWPSRREIGHGALAEKALEPLIPSEEKFPYTIRIVSEVLSSNGSTSMASVCGSSLSLMDAGVPISAPVAGLAMGLVVNSNTKHETRNTKNNHVILSDIAGIEDFNGDMDFKIAGTEKGITALQLDVKIDGLTKEIIEKTLAQAREGRILILNQIAKVLPAPRPKISQYAPKIAVLHLEVDKIGEVVGPGGRTIRKIINETSCAVDIKDDGTTNISGTDEESVSKAIAWIENLTREVKTGDVFEGTVKRIQPFGAFVEILPGREGLVHVSQMASGYVADPRQIVSIDKKVKVRVTDVEQGKISLSMISGEEAARKRTTRDKTRRPIKSYSAGRSRTVHKGTGPRRLPSSSFRRPSSRQLPSSRWQR